MPTTTTIHAAIIGASGYTGAELVRLLHEHPSVKIVGLAAESNAGKPMSDVFPHLEGFGLPEMVLLKDIAWEKVDVAFCCLPHAASHEAVSQIPTSVKIVDLSADFRFSDIALYEEWYQHKHSAASLQKEVVYGMVELFRDQIKKARVVANPGCYPTSAILPLFPLIKKDVINAQAIIVDSKSGISGAGRKLLQSSLFTEMDGGMKAYGISTHRHTPEIEHTLSFAAKGVSPRVQFTPQVVPMSRGILSNIYVESNVDANEIRNILSDFYRNEPFVRIEAEGRAPSTREVLGTNQCRIGVFAGRLAGRAVITSVIDNLVKGASGQAVQNMNVLFDLPETMGLDRVAVFP